MFDCFVQCPVKGSPRGRSYCRSTLVCLPRVQCLLHESTFLLCPVKLDNLDICYSRSTETSLSISFNFSPKVTNFPYLGTRALWPPVGRAQRAVALFLQELQFGVDEWWLDRRSRNGQQMWNGESQSGNICRLLHCFPHSLVYGILLTLLFINIFPFSYSSVPRTR